MFNKKNLRLRLAICLGALAALLVFALNQNTFSQKTNIKNSNIQIQVKEELSNRKSYIINAPDIAGEATLTHSPTSDLAKPIMNSFVAGIKSSFEVRSAPYAGHITTNIDCMTRKYLSSVVVPFQNNHAYLVTAVANERKLAVCSVEQIKYISGFWVTYHTKKQLILTIKVYKKTKNLEDLSGSKQDLLNTIERVANQIL